MALNLEQLTATIIGDAQKVAGGGWKDIQNAAVIEFRSLAQRIVLIVQGYAAGELTQKMARRHLRLARFHAAASLAMLTMLTEASAEKIVNGALATVRQAVNTSIGFALL